jgi:hypothetical protein
MWSFPDSATHCVLPPLTVLVLPAWQVLVISQCNVELPEAVRRMSKLERLVRAFFLQFPACSVCLLVYLLT